jgi:hypothetical protein
LFFLIFILIVNYEMTFKEGFTGGSVLEEIRVPFFI